MRGTVCKGDFVTRLDAKVGFLTRILRVGLLGEGVCDCNNNREYGTRAEGKIRHTCCFLFRISDTVELELSQAPPAVDRGSMASTSTDTGEIGSQCKHARMQRNVDVDPEMCCAGRNTMLHLSVGSDMNLSPNAITCIFPAWNLSPIR